MKVTKVPGLVLKTDKRRYVYGEHNGEQVPEGVYIAEAPSLDLRTTFVIGHSGVTRRRS